MQIRISFLPDSKSLAKISVSCRSEPFAVATTEDSEHVLLTVVKNRNGVWDSQTIFALAKPFGLKLSFDTDTIVAACAAKHGVNRHAVINKAKSEAFKIRRIDESIRRIILHRRNIFHIPEGSFDKPIFILWNAGHDRELAI